MFALARQLLKDFSFLLKILELIIASVCLHELTKYNEYSMPRWLWVIYCIDTSTYSIIYFSIGMTHVFDKPRRVAELTCFSIGVIFNLVGAIMGIERAHNSTSLDLEVHRSEMKIGLLLLGNFVILFFETAYIVYTEILRIKNAT